MLAGVSLRSGCGWLPETHMLDPAFGREYAGSLVASVTEISAFCSQPLPPHEDAIGRRPPGGMDLARHSAYCPDDPFISDLQLWEL